MKKPLKPVPGPDPCPDPVTRTPNDLKNQSLAVTLPILTDLLLNPEARVRDQEVVPAASSESRPVGGKKTRKKKGRRR